MNALPRKLPPEPDRRNGRWICKCKIIAGPKKDDRESDRPHLGGRKAKVCVTLAGWSFGGETWQSRGSISSTVTRVGADRGKAISRICTSKKNSSLARLHQVSASGNHP